MVNAYDHKELLKRAFDIDLTKLGCVMLDIKPLKSEFIVPKEWEYVSSNPNLKWIKGLVETQHITLLYGLLQNANNIKPSINRVLKGWEPSDLELEYVDFFPSTYPDENYSCIVGHMKLTDNLLEAHHRLSFLPHIDTHPGYKPHVTLAYVKKNYQNESIKRFARKFDGTKLEADKLNFGYKP